MSSNKYYIIGSNKEKFVVYVFSNYVEVWDKSLSKKLYKFDFIEILIPKPLKKLSSCYSREKTDKYSQNSILLLRRINNNLFYYTFIGEAIYKFSTKYKITTLYSPINDKLVTFPYGFDTNDNVYLFNTDVVMEKNILDGTKFKDYYEYYLDVTNKNHTSLIRKFHAKGISCNCNKSIDPIVVINPSDFYDDLTAKGKHSLFVSFKNTKKFGNKKYPVSRENYIKINNVLLKKLGLSLMNNKFLIPFD